MTEVEAERIAEAVVAKLRDTPEGRPLYTPATLAERLGLSERTVRDMIVPDRKTGAPAVIPSFTVQSGRRIDPEAVEEYLESQRRAEMEG